MHHAHTQFIADLKDIRDTLIWDTREICVEKWIFKKNLGWKIRLKIFFTLQELENLISVSSSDIAPTCGQTRWALREKYFPINNDKKGNNDKKFPQKYENFNENV